MYNSFSQRQLDDMIHFWIQDGRISLVPASVRTCGGMRVYRAHKTPGQKYPQGHIREEWKNKWRENGDFVPKPKQIMIHVVYWRWSNQYKLLDENLEISHLWKARNDILYLCQESEEMNDSRKYCMLFNWWHPDNKDVGCNHHPRCWGDL